LLPRNTMRSSSHIAPNRESCHFCRWAFRLKIGNENERPLAELVHLNPEEGGLMALFDETYRVIAVDSQCLTVRGTTSGEVMTIVNTNPELPLSEAEYPLGQLIALTDPSASTSN
jgi:phage tail protein X